MNVCYTSWVRCLGIGVSVLATGLTGCGSPQAGEDFESDVQRIALLSEAQPTVIESNEELTEADTAPDTAAEEAPDDDEFEEPNCDKDTTAPLLECPEPTPYLVGDKVVAAQPLVLDSCDGQPLVEIAKQADVVEEGMDTVEIAYTAVDEAGNASECVTRHPVVSKTLTTCSFDAGSSIAELNQVFTATASLSATSCPGCEWTWDVRGYRPSTGQLTIFGSQWGLSYLPSSISVSHTYTNPAAIGTDWRLELNVRGYVETTPGYIRTVSSCGTTKNYVVTDTVPPGTYCGQPWTQWQTAINNGSVVLQDFTQSGSGVNFNGGGSNTRYLILGSPHDDTLRGSWLNDCIYAGAGNDKVWGDSSSDEIHGGTGADELHGDDGYDEIYGEDGADKIWGGRDDDEIYGGEGADDIQGNQDDDELHGGNGDDIIHGNGGFDQIWGDNHNDSLYGDGDSDVIWGGNGDDTLRGNDGNDQLYGEAGNDNIQGDLHSDYINGGDNNDDLSGGDGNDDIYGGDGNDVIHGNGDDDDIYGGPGNDVIDGDNGSDNLYGEDGMDALRGGSGNDYLDGGNGKDKLDGNAGSDTLRGGPKLDLLHGGDDGDYLYGDDWSDVICGQGGPDTLVGGPHSSNGDYCRGGPGSDTVSSCENSLSNSYCGVSYWNSW